MGTRHLIAVIQGGTHKIAQYGQWDGYPEGQGAEVLAFLGKVNLDTFSERVKALHFITDEEAADINTRAGIGVDEQWITMEQASAREALAPQLSRNTSANVLGMVERGEVEFVDDAYNFGQDSVFCEFAYVIDLDTQRFEAYKGFQSEPHTDGRFAQEPFVLEEHRTKQYYPVRLVASWPLSALPSAEELVAEYARLNDEVEDEEGEWVPQTPDTTVHIYDENKALAGLMGHGMVEPEPLRPGQRVRITAFGINKDRSATVTGILGPLGGFYVVEPDGRDYLSVYVLEDLEVIA